MAQDGGQVLRSSALALVKQVLSMTDIHSKHRRELLTIGLWKWTEAPGVSPHPKYNIRYVSRGVLGEDAAKINHEHVWPRRWIIDSLLSRNDWTIAELEELLDAYGVACVVTTEEHARLSGGSGQGWQRYIQAKVDVWDRQLGRWAELAADLSPDPAVKSEPAEAEEPSAAALDLQQVLSQRSGERAALLSDLARWVELEEAIAVVGGTQDPQQPIGAYFRIHDTQIEEPTPTVAYAHWNGRISFRLVAEDLPAAKLTGIQIVSHAKYGVECRVSDDGTLRVAKDLLFLALEKLRGHL
ncbi:hypothetical protein AB0F43_09995 [Kribbella sp. NPDC023972]|uniref:hypothetical protein n=1 Tax=Kribbella sp. NPDC023972 TaxID=3154795 RepID=UPI0033C6CC1B